MTDAKVVFNDGEAYERFMGRWSRAAGGAFLEWLAPPKGAHWLDVGCGTGAFTELVIGSCSPASIVESTRLLSKSNMPGNYRLPV